MTKRTYTIGDQTYTISAAQKDDKRWVGTVECAGFHAQTPTYLGAAYALSNATKIAEDHWSTQQQERTREPAVQTLTLTLLDAAELEVMKDVLNRIIGLFHYLGTLRSDSGSRYICPYCAGNASLLSDIQHAQWCVIPRARELKRKLDRYETVALDLTTKEQG